MAQVPVKLMKTLTFQAAGKVKQRFAELNSRYQNFDIQTVADMALSISWVESRFIPESKNANSTARGLMQVIKGTKEWMEKDFLKIPIADINKMYDPEYALMIGITYLVYQYIRYDKNREKTIWSYNQGSFQGLNPCDGQTYLGKVSEAYERFIINGDTSLLGSLRAVPIKNYVDGSIIDSCPIGYDEEPNIVAVDENDGWIKYALLGLLAVGIAGAVYYNEN